MRASVGHVRDLPKSNKKAIDIDGGFIPHYEVSKGKEKILSEIKAAAKKAGEIYLATDPDREGEAIAWHLKEALGLKKPKRIVFHEITKAAVEEALKHPRDIDDNLKLAQEARRVLDRLVGYDLSGLIWKKVRYGLSAGRVQSPALRIIMEREREIRAFIPEEFFVLRGSFDTDAKKKTVVLNLTCEEEPRDGKEAERILELGRKNPWHVIDVAETEAKRSPRAPFITSTLQQTASSRLGFSPSRAMSVAQKLYEKGLITYMRTDSTNLSAQAVKEIAGVITKKFGANYLETRVYKTKSKNAQEAHEAIRPTSAAVERGGVTDDEKKLYKLIWDRTVSSQMSDAKLLRTKISATISGGTIPSFSATGSVVLFPGWLMADQGARGEDVELPKLKAGTPLYLIDLESERKETEPPPRYTEAGLVKELEKRDIGRPSTYASIIGTIQTRGYVEKINKALHPTDTGDVVSTFLEQNFASYISDSFTAEMEDKLDQIAEGKLKYLKLLQDFYKPFQKEIKIKDKLEKATNMGTSDFKCPLCEGPMVIKLARSGRFLSCENFPKCTGARKIDGTIMEGPKETGEMCPTCKTGKLLEREGRFGKFIACSNYPKCKYIKESPEEEARKKTGIQCPVCKKGEMVERRGRFGLFYSCSDYPTCKNAIKAKPTGNICKLCGSLMMEGTKTIPERCSNKSCLNHNPHKLKNS